MLTLVTQLRQRLRLGSRHNMQHEQQRKDKGKQKVDDMDDVGQASFQDDSTYCPYCSAYSLTEIFDMDEDQEREYREQKETLLRTHQCSRSCRTDEVAQKHDVELNASYSEPQRHQDLSKPLPRVVDHGDSTLTRFLDQDIFWNSVMDEMDGHSVGTSEHIHKRGRRSLRRVAVARPSMSIRGCFRQQDADPSLPSNDTATSMHEKSENQPRFVTRGRTRERQATVSTASSSESSVSPRSTPLHSSQSNSRYSRLRNHRRKNYRRSQTPLRTTEASTTPDLGVLRGAMPVDTANTTSLQQRMARYEARRFVYDPLDHVWTWNSALNTILASSIVDSETKRRIRDRIQERLNVNGSTKNRTRFVTLQGAGLVPSFSYPIIASRFCDHTYAQAHPRASMNPGVEPLETRQLQRRDEARPRVTTREVLIDDGTTSSSSSVRRTVCSRLVKSPDDQVPKSDVVGKSVHELLRTIFTPSELDLHKRVISGVGSTTRGRSPTRRSETNSSSSSSPELYGRVVLVLYSALLGLQTDKLYLEDSLVPKLSEWLKRKSDQLQLFQRDLFRLCNEATALKNCVNFVIETLNMCRRREHYLCNTLKNMCRQRSMHSRGSTKLSKLLRDQEINSLSLLAASFENDLEADMQEMASILREFKEEYGELCDVKFCEMRWRLDDDDERHVETS